jgi:hypothetical protein
VKDYCSRARAALNLILVLSLLQAWVLFSLPNSPESIDHDLEIVYEKLAPHFSHNRNLPAAREPLDKFVVNLSKWEFADRDEATLATFDIPYVPRLEDDVYWTMVDQAHAEKADVGKIDAEKVREAASSVASALTHIKELERRSGLPATATIRDLKRHYSREVEVPVLKQSIEPNDVILVLELATVFPLAILFVLLDSMTLVLRKVKGDGKSIDPLDCIFFYRSWSAIPVSVIWLLSPLGLMLSQAIPIYLTHDSIEAVIAYRLVFWSILVLVPACLFRAWTARSVYLALSDAKEIGEKPKCRTHQLEDDDDEDRVKLER